MTMKNKQEENKEKKQVVNLLDPKRANHIGNFL